MDRRVELKQIFDAVDLNKDGKLSREEVDKMISDAHTPSGFSSHRIHALADAGTLDFEHFYAFVVEREKDLKEVFAHLDESKTGTINASDIGSALNHLGLTATKEAPPAILNPACRTSLIQTCCRTSN